MICRECLRRGEEVEMREGQALIPTWGNYRNNHSRGSTIYHVGSVQGSVVKCPDCGHSVSFHGQLMQVLPSEGYIYKV
jgi:PHP family Zn ribbon phosphoesterase